MVWVNGISLDIDVHDYLASKSMYRIRTVGENVMACCPFHSERSPSFGVHVDTGAYNCFGCGAKGTFGQLVKHLDGFDTVSDAEQYLVARYGRFSTVVDEPLDLPQLDEPDKPYMSTYAVDESIMTPLRWRHPYLENRGIPDQWQRVFEVGYDRDKRAISIPWRDESGRLVSLKMRSVRGKSFWYHPPMPDGLKGRVWFGLNHVLRRNLDTVVITEAEIDCMSVWSIERVGAIAIGGNQPTFAQTTKLIRLLRPDTKIIVFCDNDSGGNVAKSILVDRLCDRFRMYGVDWSMAPPKTDGTPPKDANDVPPEIRTQMLLERYLQPLGITL